MRQLGSPHACASIKRSWQRGWSGRMRPYKCNSMGNTMACLLAVDPEYPAPLAEIPDPPFLLFAQGNIERPLPEITGNLYWL